MSSLTKRLTKKRKTFLERGFKPSPIRMSQVDPSKVIEMLPSVAKEIVNARMEILERKVKQDADVVIKELKDLVPELKQFTDEQIAEHIRTRAIEIRGEDGAAGKDGKDGMSGYTPIKGVDYSDGEKGEKGSDGSPDTPDQVVQKVNKAEKLIKIEKIDGLLRELEAIKRNVRERGEQFGGRTLHRGGATFDSSLMTPLTGTVDDSNATFTFAYTPSAVIVNGATYVEGLGVTITGITAVLDNPAGVNGFVRGLR